MAAFDLADEIAAAPTEHDHEPEKYAVWPDNLQSLNVFMAMAHQWGQEAVQGELVRTRLMMEVAEVFMNRLPGIAHRERSEIFGDLVHMESAALAAFNTERNERLEREATQRRWRDRN